MIPMSGGPPRPGLGTPCRSDAPPDALQPRDKVSVSRVRPGVIILWPIRVYAVNDVSARSVGRRRDVPAPPAGERGRRCAQRQPGEHLFIFGNVLDPAIFVARHTASGIFASAAWIRGHTSAVPLPAGWMDHAITTTTALWTIAGVNDVTVRPLSSYLINRNQRSH